MSDILGWGFTAVFTLSYAMHILRLWRMRNMEEETEIDNVSIGQMTATFAGFFLLGAYGLVLTIDLICINALLGMYYAGAVIGLHLMFRDEQRAESRRIIRDVIKSAKKNLKKT